MPNVDVTVDASPNHQVKLSSGGSTFRIMGLGREEFPPLPEFGDEKAFTLDQAELSAMLKKVAYAQSADETRYILNGVYFNFRDAKLSLVATDGRRLAVVVKEMEVPASSAGAIILPAKTVAELTRLLDKGAQVKINFNDRAVRLPDRDGQGRQRAGGQRLPLLQGRGGQLSELPAGRAEGDAPAHQARAGALPASASTARRWSAPRRPYSVRIKLSSNLLEITAQSPTSGKPTNRWRSATAAPTCRWPLTRLSCSIRCGRCPRTRSSSSSRTTSAPGVFKTLDSFICVIMPVRLS